VNTKDLALALLYLTSWDEPGFDKGETIYRSEKTYKEELLAELHKEGLIYNSEQAKTIMFSEEGIEKVKLLLEELNIQKTEKPV